MDRPRLITAGLFLGITVSTAASGQAAPLAQARQFTHAQNSDPSLSPDGRRMVYISVVAGREQLFIRSIEGREVEQLTHDTVDHEDPAWSPDGQTIAFVYLTAKEERIARMPAIRRTDSGCRRRTCARRLPIPIHGNIGRKKPTAFLRRPTSPRALGNPRPKATIPGT